MTAIIGIDPGPTHCGIVCLEDGAVTFAMKDMPVRAVLGYLDAPWEHVAIERVQSYGIAGGSLLRTSEVVGRLWNAAEAVHARVTLHYRREILRALDVTGKGNRDALVRHRLIEMCGGTREAAVGTKKTPGPLYGVSGHAWQALAVAVVAGMS